MYFDDEGSALDQELERFRYGQGQTSTSFPRSFDHSESLHEFRRSRTPPRTPAPTNKRRSRSRSRTPPRTPVPTNKRRSRSRSRTPPLPPFANPQRKATKRDPAHQKNFRNHLATYKRELVATHKKCSEQYADLVREARQVQQRIDTLNKSMKKDLETETEEFGILIERVGKANDFLQHVSQLTQLNNQIQILNQQMTHVEQEMAKYGAPRTLYAHRQKLEKRVKQQNSPANQNTVVQGMNMVTATYLATTKQ